MLVPLETKTKSGASSAKMASTASQRTASSNAIISSVRWPTTKAEIGPVQVERHTPRVGSKAPVKCVLLYSSIE